MYIIRKYGEGKAELFLKHIAGGRFEWVTDRAQATRYEDEAAAGWIARQNYGELVEA